MNEAASVFLRADIRREDGYRLAKWMRNRNVTRYLNEKGDISDELVSLIERTPEGMLSYHLNQAGRFYLVCGGKGEPIGFIRLKPGAEQSCEIVYVIGEEPLWGRGYGRRALELALAKAFFEMRRESVIARIKKGNTRSTRTAAHCGMRLVHSGETMQVYRITAQDYLAQKTGTPQRE